MQAAHASAVHIAEARRGSPQRPRARYGIRSRATKREAVMQLIARACADRRRRTRSQPTKSNCFRQNAAFAFKPPASRTAILSSC